MVEAQQMKDRGLNVMDMNLVLGGVETELIGGSERLPRLDPGASLCPQPYFWALILWRSWA